METKALKAKASGYTAKTKTLNDKEYLVVPVVALVEGVVHAMNSDVPELVTLDAFKDAPVAFNGKPLFLGHPTRNGIPIIGSQPDVIEKSIGLVFNTQVKKNKLVCEAWVDVKAAEARGVDGEELLARIRAGEDVEVSVGIAADEIDESGTYNGKKYEDKWGPISPDHLALLPVGHTGACSVEMGCGVRAAQAKEGVENAVKDHMYIEWLEQGPETDQLLKTLRDIPQSERDKMPEEDFAGPNRSFPIEKAEDVGAAAHSLGRAKGNRNAIKRRIISIAYRKGDPFVAQLPEDWKKKADQTKAASLWQRALQAIGLKTAQSADEMTDADLKRKLAIALMDKEGAGFLCVETYHPVLDPTHVVYTVRVANGQLYDWGEPMYDYVLYERAFDLSDSGVVTLNDARIEVEPVTTFEPVEGASPITAASTKNNDAAAPCSCKTKAAATVPAEPASEESIMKFEAVNKALEAKNATPEQEAAVIAFVNGGFKAAEVTVEKVVEKEVVKEVPAAEMTREQAIEKFGLGDAVKAAASLKAASVATIKACKSNKFTDEQLNAKTQEELDAIVALTGQVVKAAVDHSARGGAKDENAGDDTTVAPAPSLDDKIKAARAKK